MKIDDKIREKILNSFKDDIFQAKVMEYNGREKPSTTPSKISIRKPAQGTGLRILISKQILQRLIILQYNEINTDVIQNRCYIYEFEKE